MGFRDDFKQVVSDTQMYRQAGNGSVIDAFNSKILLDFENKEIEMPKRFLPNKEFLEYHRNIVSKEEI